MKISVVTPSLNSARFIEDAIVSVLDQGYENFEHIIIDGGSTDGTFEILKKYPHVRLISEPDGGQSDAINKGFRMATGEIVAWLNSDDYYLQNTFIDVARLFCRNEGFDVLYGECMFVDANKVKLRIKKDHGFDYRVLLYYGCYLPSTSTFFKRRILDAGQFLDTSYRVTMDYEYFVRLSSLGYRFHFLRKTLAAFRWHESNLSTIYAGRRREERLKVQHMYGFKVTSNYVVQTLLYDLAACLYRVKRWILISLEMFFAGV